LPVEISPPSPCGHSAYLQTHGIAALWAYFRRHKSSARSQFVFVQLRGFDFVFLRVKVFCGFSPLRIVELLA